MSLREKAKALFKRRSNSDRDSLSKASTKNSSKETWPSNVYQPGEPMPRPKYRAIPKKEHTEKLQAFSFAEAWRKKSFQSQHSPMGTRLPSRRNSSRTVPSRANSIFSMPAQRNTSDAASAGRTNSATSVDTGPSGSKKKGQEGVPHAAKPTSLETEPEEEGEGDVRNVGLSRLNSLHRPAEDTQRPIETQLNGHAEKPPRPSSTAPDHKPFTEEELALALHRSRVSSD